MGSVHDYNRRAWDRRAREQARFAKPASDEDLIDPLRKLDGSGWLGDVRGKRLLCLAAGGGRQSIMYAAAGAQVTVVDLSEEMLHLDRQMAAQKGMDIAIVAASMDDLSALDAGVFEIVIHPVSSCYLPSVAPVYREVARVLAPGGIYVSQHKQPTSMQASVAPGSTGNYELVEPYYQRGPLSPVSGSLHREPGTLEFLHRWEDLLGGLCRAGFVIEDLSEPFHADPSAKPSTFEHRSQFVAPYVRIKARRTTAPPPSAQPKVWLPGS